MPIDQLALPRPVRRFLAEHDFLNNFAAFCLLSLLALWANSGRVAASRIMGIAAALVVVLETAQLFLPNRVFDWMDVLAGLSGVAVAADL